MLSLLLINLAVVIKLKRVSNQYALVISKEQKIDSEEFEVDAKNPTPG